MAPTPSLFGLLMIAVLLAVLVFYFLPLVFADNGRFLMAWSLVGLLLAYFCGVHLVPPTVGADGSHYAGDSQISALVITQWVFAALAQLADKIANRRGFRRRRTVIAGGWILSLAATFVLIRFINAQTL